MNENLDRKPKILSLVNIMKCKISCLNMQCSTGYLEDCVASKTIFRNNAMVHFPVES